MPLENRNLEAGTRLVATYKKQAHICTVEAGEEEGSIAYVLADGKRFKSPNAAAVSITGVAQNGWRFWSLEGEGKPASEDPTKPAKASRRKGKAKKTIYRIPNGRNLEEAKSRWFCVACMKGFVVVGNEAPE